MLYIVLAIVVFIETGLNGFFFAEGSAAGFAGGALQAILLALLNLSVASAAARYFLPMLYRRAPVSRVVGLMLLAFFVLWLVGFNLWVGHFRDLFALGESSVGLRDIFHQMPTAPLGLRDAKSLVLVALGIAAGIVAFIDVASLRDPYPGYDEVGTRRDSALSVYAEAKSRCIAALKDLRDDAIADMQRALDSSRRSSHELESRDGRARSLSPELCHVLERAGQSYQLLIRRYREGNQRARTEPVRLLT